MSGYREIEVIINIIGTEQNAMTDEPGNKIIPIRRKILMNKNLTVEDIAKRFLQAITRIEEDDA